MNNKHQELIKGKVAEYFSMFTQDIDGYEGENCESVSFKEISRYHSAEEREAQVINLKLWIEKALQDTIDTVLEEEREQVLESLTTTEDTSQMLEGWERYWIEVETNRFVENCIECENTVRILKDLDKTPPNKV